jgi:hypothetical protein
MTPNLIKRRLEGAASRAFLEAVQGGAWPHDTSDDPSFFASKHFGGPITWGICRPNLRCLLRVGDVVVFFSDEADGRMRIYRFCGFATVARKVTQEAIWRDPDLAPFQSYLNVMAAPDGDGAFVNRELHPDHPHPDWLWRAVCPRGNSWRKSDFANFGTDARVRLGIDVAANGQPIRFAANYIVFDHNPRMTYVVGDPPVVAERDLDARRGPHENWRDSEIAERLYDLTLARAKANRRFLRTSDGQSPHPYAVLTVGPAAWRTEALQTIRELHL